MKSLRLGIFFLVLGVIGLSSCDKDCTPPALSENIVGNWDFQLSGGSAEFQADGTLIDPDDTVIGFESNGVAYDQKSYVVNGDTSFTVTAKPSSGPGSTSFEFPVTSNECDEIKLEIIGITETMKRK
jgi:hypothetical protein